MIMGILLSFFGASCLASLIVFVACVASSRADRIQQGAFEQTAASAERLVTVSGQPVSNPKLALGAPSL